MTNNAKEAIRCENLSKHFGSFVALDDLTLTITKGSSFGFLGPNGAGKTTTLRLLAGLTHPTSGQVWIDGQDVSGNSLRLRSSIGYLPESPAFYGWMTGFEFLRFTGQLHGLDKAASSLRAEELLRQVNLSDAANRKTRGYSRGMQQRLGLAQALINHPKVLLLDEPASALDPMGRRDMLETIQGLRGETTIFISTHILADVERICDQVAIINKGKIVASGSIADLRAQSHPSRFEIEAEEDLAPVAKQLEKSPWARAVSFKPQDRHPVLLVDAKDVDVAKKELPRLLVNNGLTLLRYELKLASLEEVFMDLVGEKGKDHK
jgi:ABC-2 type transport system ATP-binding protein